jgi:O-antigen/teichoic acid export membrane protein
MSRSRRFLGGLSLGYLYQAVTMLSAVWLMPFFLKYVGQRSYGLWLVALQILSYLMLMDFGIVALLPRETAYATGRAISGKEGKSLPDIIGLSARVVLYQTPLVALAVAVSWLAMPKAWHELSGPTLLIMVCFTALFPTRIFQAVLQGLQDTAFLGRTQLLGWGLNTGLSVFLILAGLGVYGLVIGWFAMQAVIALLAFVRLRRHFPGVLPSRLPKLSRQELLGSLGSGLWVSAAQIAQVMIGSTDFVIIGKSIGPSAVVPYACTNKLMTALGNQPLMVMEMAAPGLSQMKTSEAFERIFRVSSALTLGVVTITGAVACVVLAVNHGFVSWWLGEGQFGGSKLTAVLVVMMLLRHWNVTTVYSIFSLGYERRICVTTFLDGIVTVAAGIFLVRWLGPVGAPLGSITGVCLISLPGNLAALASAVRVRIFDVMLSIWPWFWRFVIVAAIGAVLGMYWQPSLFYTAGIALLTASLYGALMLPMIMDSRLRAYLPSQATRLWDGLCNRLSPSGAVDQS